MVSTRSAPALTPGRSKRSPRPSDTHRTGTRSLSRVTEDDTDEDPDVPLRRTAPSIRSSSAIARRTHRLTRSATATSVPGITGAADHSPPSKRARIRPSLAGPQIHEMDIETRAQVLIPIAEDCIIQLLKAGLNGSLYRPGTSSSWQLAWDSLQTQRRNKLFSPDSLPFNDYDDVREAFHATVRANINTASLERAIHLANLATFIWVLLRPDEAHLLLPEEGDGFRRGALRGMSMGPSGSGVQDPHDVVKMVAKRNRVLRMAWKRFWKDVIPRNMRSNKSAIERWATFSTQIMMSYGSPTIDGTPSSVSPNLPRPDPEISAELFAASAIIQHGQWAIGEQISGRDATDKTRAQRHWAKTANLRKNDLHDLRDEVLVDKYPYDEFRRDMLGFIDDEILHTLISQSISPRKPDLAELASSQPPSEDEQFLSSEVEHEVENPPQVGVAGTVDPESASSPAIPDNVEMDLDLDIDLLNQILAEEMEADESLGDGRDDEFPSEINSESDTPARRSVAITETDVRSQQKPQVGQAGEDDAEWKIKHSSAARAPAPTIGRRFNFAAPQASAQQVDWESQSQQARTPTRKSKRGNEPLFLPTHDMDSDGSRSPSATPRPPGRLAPQIRSPSRSVDVSPRPGFEDLEDLMPGTSELGDPVSSSIHPSQSPSPVRNGDTHMEDLAADHHAGPIPTTSPAPAADIPRLPPRSQRFLIDARRPRKRNSGFASPDSADSVDIALSRPPLIHVPTPSRPTPRTSIAPLHGISQDPPKPKPRKSGASDASRDFIVVPPLLSPDINEREDRATVAGSSSSASRPRWAVEATPTARHVSEASTSPNHGGTEAAHSPPPLPQYDDFHGTASRSASVASVASPNPREEASPSHGGPPAASQPRAGRHRQRFVDTGDSYLVDEDESPLEPNPDFTLPVGYLAQQSVLHGRIGNQQSTYSRRSGSRKWSDEEQLLLYRTVQKVPLIEPYPLRVVWYLYGENGTISHALENYNTQHMKDKMKSIVDVRVNNGFPVVGRARFWLKPIEQDEDGIWYLHPDKQALEDEIKQAERDQDEREQPARKAAIAEAAARLKAKKAEREAKKAAAIEAKLAEREAKKAERERKKAEKEAKKRKKGKSGSRTKRKDTPDEIEEEEEEEQEQESDHEGAEAEAEHEQGDETGAGPSHQDDEAHTQGEDEDNVGDFEPERKASPRKTRQGRQTRSGRKIVSPAQATQEEYAESQAAESERDASAPNAGPHRSPSYQSVTPAPSTRPKRRILYVEIPIPARRTVSRNPSRSVTATESESEPQSPIPQPGSISPNNLESAGETLYQNPARGKMMKRNAPPPVLDDTLSSAGSSVEDVESEVEDETSETGTSRPGMEADHVESDAGDSDREAGVEDEDEENEKLVRQELVRQQVMGGIPQSLR